jgi:hypothetical protein
VNGLATGKGDEDRIVAQQSITSPRITNVFPALPICPFFWIKNGKENSKFARLAKKPKLFVEIVENGCEYDFCVLEIIEMAGPTRSFLFTSRSPRQPLHRLAEPSRFTATNPL